MQFAYEAMTADGRVVTDYVEGNSSTEAVEAIHGKGLTLMRLDQGREGGDKVNATEARRGSRRIKQNDIVLFTQQLKMLLEAGSSLVPALEAVGQQAAKTSVKELVGKIRQHVEEGGTLTEAFNAHPHIFKPVFCSMISAGEATAALPDTFDRLNELSVRQQKTRKTVIGALLYPAILSVLCTGVAGVVIGFVVPRFTTLFESLNSPLPPLTEIFFAISEKALAYWPMGGGALVALVLGVVIAIRVQSLRVKLDTLLLKVPMIGPVASRLIFARVLRIWAAMLRCHVPLIETIQHSKSALTNLTYIALIQEVEESVSGGGSIGRTLSESGLVEPVIASAIRTGEENGRLSEAVEFVSSWMDSDNAQLVAGLTRIVEPVLLAGMGLFVGLVAMSLFIPLFDLAMAGG